jgi:rhamnogalacturonan endolyase
MSAICLTLGLMINLAGLAPEPPAGRRADLGIEGATLFVPEGFKPGPGGVVDVVLHLHGATSVIEPALVDARWPAVLIAFNRKGLSRVYTEPFSDPKLFSRLLDAARSALKDLHVADDPRIGRVAVSSFSAGFGGVRAMLKVPEHFARIDGLIMADSIYCGYTGDPKDHRVDPALMDGFRRFAVEAAAGRKTFLLTHSALVPEGYASTGEVADFLIDAVGGKAEPAKVAWADAWTQTRAFSKGQFVVLGFAGTEGADHMSHLRQINKLWKRYRAIPVDLFRDDFSRYPPGWLTMPLGQLNGAIQEYHYLPHRGVPLGPWANAICHLDAWAVGDEEGTTYLEQHTVNVQAALMNPLFITGDPEWRDYTLDVEVKPLSLDDMAGVVFRYHTNRHYYLFALTGGKTARLAVRLPLEKAFRVAEWRELGSITFPYDTTHYYRLTVENAGTAIKAYVDGKLVLTADDGELLLGKVGVTANIPARFRDFRVAAPDEVQKRISDRIARREAELTQLRAENPRPKLWKSFTTPRFGAGRNARFGDLDGDGVPEMLIAQNIPRIGDNFIQISCMTAVTFDGKVLWQLGRPDPRNGLLTADTPFQIHNIDGDGRNEVVMVKDFQLQIREGSTGQLRRFAGMPPALPDNRLKPYTLTNADSLAFLDLSAQGKRREFMIKDRYSNFWVYNNRLEPIWRGQGQTGHYPYPFDIDDDGHEEIAIGYAVWDRTGRQLWSHDQDLHDHADGLAVGRFGADPKAEPRVYAWGSDEGFLVFDRHGTILEHVRIGHAQSASVGKFRPDLPGLQLMCVNFWKNPGIVTLFDAEGKILAQEEPIHSGSPMLPVNWRGDGQEFVLLSGNAREGGMIDGQLRRVVMFPDDGHPDLTAYVANVTGDARDEVILWDQERVWIYTQDRPSTGKRLYAPIRNSDSNESNYRTVVSRPGWIEQDAKN